MKKILIWGAGMGGHRAYDILQYNYKIEGFIDSNEQYHNRRLFDIPIIAPESIPEQEYDYILIANPYVDEILPVLNKLGVDPDKILDYMIDSGGWPHQSKPSPVPHVFFTSELDLRIEALSAITREICRNNVSGSVAELGVWKGDFAAYIGAAFKDRPFYLFDTFTGFDERDIKNEKSVSTIEHESNRFSDTNVNMVLEKICNPERCIVKKGYFPETAVGLETEFCFVSLDADLYDPIKSGLEYFYKRLSKGGYILVHDYNSVIYSGAGLAVQDFCADTGALYMPLESCSSVVVLK